MSKKEIKETKVKFYSLDRILSKGADYNVISVSVATVKRMLHYCTVSNNI